MSDKSKDDGFLFETKRLSPEEMAKVRGSHATASDAALSVMLVYRDGVEMVSLSDGQSVVVGRGAPSDVAIRDSSLSRQHAVLEVLGGVLWLEDLGSTNGTWVNGKRCERSNVTSDDEILFGAVRVIVVVGDSRGTGGQGLDGHERLRRELGMEVARARQHHRRLALAVVRDTRRQDSRIGQWVPQTRAMLREFDRMAMYSPDTAEILLPEADAAEALSVLAPILERYPALACGVALFPAHAGNAEALIEVALHTCQQLSAGSRLTVYSAGTSDSVVPRRSAWVVGSALTQRLVAEVARVAQANIPVLILGETGAGKEVAARAIHEGSKRSDRPLVCVNCASIPSQLVESTLFGYERGAFTGATQRTQGVFEAAHGGTVLLDEIGELPPPAQAALLRVLELRKITRVGSTREVDVDVRVLAATHRNLESMVRDGAFRQDLLFRLNVMTIRVPPLRERPEDIEPLATAFLRAANDANGCRIEGIDPEAMELLVRYSWPGNVRELRNAIERAVVIATGSTITVEDLPTSAQQLQDQRAPDESDADAVPPGEMNLREEVAKFEAGLILRTLRACDGDRTRAARALGLPLRTLAHKMQTHGIRRAYADR